MFPLQYLGRLDSHHRQGIALFVALLGYFLFLGHAHLATLLIAVWDVYVAALLMLAWCTLLTADPVEVQKTARLQDSNSTALFAFVVVSAFASLFAVIYLLSGHKDLSHGALGRHMTLSILAVIESWSLIHTVFTLRYAHIYYRDQKEKDVEGNGGGLDFPGSEEPDYLDFAYFAFVIGMTFQVSDVAISSKPIRRLALLQGLLSFAFNTAILALSLNILSGLLG